MKLSQSIKQSWRSLVAPVLLLAAVTVTLAGVSSVLAWGPNRDTYTTAKPANHVTFNSITNNPAHGDETNFMQVRESTASNETYADEIALATGKEYVIYIYYHNNAADNYNATGVGVAKGAYARAEVPAIVRNGTAGTKANAFVGADNAKHFYKGVDQGSSVFDDITFKNTTGGDIALRYVPGSTTIHSRGPVNGTIMPDTILQTGGVKLGYNALDGVLPGCNEYAGFITFRVKADQPNFTFKKQVREVGSKDWQDEVSTKIGTEVEYRLEYKNTGTTEQRDVTMKDTLPKGVSYVNGSAKLYNSNNPSGMALEDGINQGGVNIGHYGAGANAIVTFRAKVAGGDMVVCGVNTFTNTAGVETLNGNRQDTAKVKITKECKKPIEVCELETRRIISIEERDFNGKKHSKNKQDCADTPVAELPQTGPTAMIGAMLLLMTVGMGAVYFIRSRQERKRQLEAEFGKHFTQPKVKLLEAHITKKPE